MKRRLQEYYSDRIVMSASEGKYYVRTFVSSADEMLREFEPLTTQKNGNTGNGKMHQN